MTASDKAVLLRLAGGRSRAGASVDDLQGLLLQITLAIMAVFIIAFFIFRVKSEAQRKEEVLKLNRLRESRKGDFLRESRIFSEDGAVELRFTPWRDELFARDIRLLYFRSHCTVGKLSGTIDIGGYGTINIENVPILCEHSRFRF